MRLLRSATALAFALLISFAVAPIANASVNYTDTWEREGSTEPGWGINFAHTGDFIFVTFYIYGPDRAPVWYTAQLSRTVGESFTGKLYATTGTWFGAPVFTPVPPSDVVEVGTATFTAIDPTRGTLAYSVNGVPVTKPIQRFTTVPMIVGGATTAVVYLGTTDGSRTGTCPTNPPTAVDVQQVGITQSATNFVQILFVGAQASNAGQLLCVLQGNVVQRGSLLRASLGQYQCAGGPVYAAEIESIRPLDTGVEIRWNANYGGNCSIDRRRFIGLKQQ